MGILKVTVADTLFSKVRQRVLTLLYGQPDSDFYTNEIIRFTASGTGVVQRELEQLVAAGLVITKQVGNQKRYQANRSSPLFSELRSIVIKTFGLADVIRHALKPIAKSIQSAFIYGSIAKQTDTLNSDIDLMIIGDKLSYSDIFKLLQKSESQLGRKINPTLYSRSEWVRKMKDKNNFIMQVINHPKIILIGADNEFEKFG